MKRSMIAFQPSYVAARLHLVVIVACVALALSGHTPEIVAGWVVWPPVAVVGVDQERRRGRRRGGRRERPCGGSSLGLGHHYLRRTWRVPVCRCLLLALLWQLSRGGWPWGFLVAPWLVWGWQLSGACWPRWRCQPEWRWGGWLGRQIEWLVLGVALAAVATTWLGDLAQLQALREGQWPSVSPVLCLCTCLTCDRQTPAVTVDRLENGDVSATLCGHFTLHVPGEDPFRVRLAAMFLRQLEVPGHRRPSRRTRDGRMPFVRQQALAAALHVVHPDLSRWERYWLAGDWRRLLSQHSPEVLTLELQARIVTVCATFPWWGVERVHAYLQDQGLAVSLRQVRQAAQDSGWTQLRQELVQRYHLTPESVRPRDDWLVAQLLAQVELLLAKVEAGAGLTPQEQLDLADLRALATAVGAGTAEPPGPSLSWALRLEQVLFGPWEAVTDDEIRCPYCGATMVSRKSRTPRHKRFYDQAGQIQTVPVYRYYCHNPACDKRTFTHLPPGLVPYSPYRQQVHLLAVQVYAWGYSTYRRTATALGVAPFTVYRWVRSLGEDLLPVAALFGVVRSSGVVGIDEKFVLVPKNDKPASPMRRWMYVYVAVDQYTYDLLHIAIYPYNTQASAHAFLLALRAKGYQPRVVVTDLREDYGPLIAQVFPEAVHHECIFHALQNLDSHLKAAYGADYARTHPPALALKADIAAIFGARTQRTAQQRYAAVLSQREAYLSQSPAGAAVFDFLERHGPRLLNAIQSPTIPRTNNVTEQVIRRFDQHYQSFCGFDTLPSTQLYLGVFEKLYRFTPFSDDAQPRLRGKCPLELAGYDIRGLPMTAICAGWSPHWPVLPAQSDVPSP